MSNVVIVSDAQQRDSAMYIHVSILPQTPLPPRPPRNAECSTPHCAAGPRRLSTLNRAMCVCRSQIP